MKVKVGDKMKSIDFLKENGVDVDAGIEILGDIEMYNETLSDFLDVSSERLPKLEESRQKGDMKNYAIEVHAMKGDSKYLGFTKLASISLEHQLKSEENDVNYVNEHYDELMEEANRIIDIVTTYLQ